MVDIDNDKVERTMGDKGDEDSRMEGMSDDSEVNDYGTSGLHIRLKRTTRCQGVRS